MLWFLIFSIVLIMGLNSFWLIIIVIIEKKIVSNVVNGSVFLNVLFSECFLIILVKVVVRIIIDKLIRLMVVK